MRILHNSKNSRRGFTLVELLIVITFIVVLSVLAFMGARRGLIVANQSRTTSQMREIGVAVVAWAAENNNNEPMYFSEGRGDESHERTAAVDAANRKFCGGNPAVLLYDKVNPEQGYIQDHTVLFAPTQIWKVPSATDYAPALASTTRLWGTYVWVYPSVPAAERTERQKNIMRGSTITTVSREAYDNLLMFSDDRYAKLKYPKEKSYFALFRDSTVRKVVPKGDIWSWYATGQ